MAESEEELNSLLMKVKEESENVGLKLNIQKTKIMASSPITSWQIDGEKVDPCSALKGETVPDSLPATPKSPPTRRVPSRATPRVPAPLPMSPFSPPDRDRRGDSPAWSGRGSRPSRRTSGKRCRDPRCSPRGNPACRGTFGGRRKAVRDRLALQGGTGDFP